MGKVSDEIIKYSKEADKECLLWLIQHYHMSSNIYFVMSIEWIGGPFDAGNHRLWKPTKEGWVLFDHRAEMQFD